MIKYRCIIGNHIEIGEYGCWNCKNYLPEHYRCIVDKCIHGDKNGFVGHKIKVDKEKKNKEHKWKGCQLVTFTGTKYFCILPRCNPKLGNFNGADRNVK